MEYPSNGLPSAPQPRKPRRLDPLLLTTTASKTALHELMNSDSAVASTATSSLLQKVELGPAEPFWDTVADYIASQGLSVDFLTDYPLIKDWNITDIETGYILKSLTIQAGPYIHPMPICYATPHAKKDKPVTGKENAHTIAEFLLASRESKNVKIGFFHTGNGSSAHRSDQEIEKWQWHCWAAAIIDNPENKPGKHMLIFDCNAYNEEGKRITATRSVTHQCPCWLPAEGVTAVTYGQD